MPRKPLSPFRQQIRSFLNTKLHQNDSDALKLEWGSHMPDTLRGNAATITYREVLRIVRNLLQRQGEIIVHFEDNPEHLEMLLSQVDPEHRRDTADTAEESNQVVITARQCANLLHSLETMGSRHHVSPRTEALCRHWLSAGSHILNEADSLLRADGTPESALLANAVRDYLEPAFLPLRNRAGLSRQ